MLVWGGYVPTWPETYYIAGGRYNPSTDAWSSMETNGAPVARTDHAAVWTGSELVVWGGYTSDGTRTYLKGWRQIPSIN